MAEISCPACGELNPQGSVECKSCHADLTAAETSSAQREEQASSSMRQIPGENSPLPDSSLPGEEAHLNPVRTEENSPEEDSKTPEWLRRIRLRYASEQSPVETDSQNLDSTGWEEGDGLQAGATNQRQGKPSGDFLDWSDPERQSSDTLPIVPGESAVSGTFNPQGTLAAMADASSPEQFLQIQPPSAFSYNLRITSTQHAHADLLDSIVNSEGISMPLPRRKQASTSHLLRWIVGAVLIAVVLWPILIGTQGAPLPVVPEETGQVNNLIEQLPEEASVLLAFDYDPGFSAELDAAAAAVVDHLLSRGAYLTLVSTIPVGPVLAERFLSQTVGLQDLDQNTRYVNLGFIPGGPAGLLSLSEDLQRTFPYTMDGEAAWNRAGEQSGRAELPPLLGIEEISDFNLILVLVDDSSTARSWIEQVQPSIKRGSFQTPMAMVVSAQAEPLVRAYYEANPRQIQGFVAGLQGGIAYQQMTGREGVPGSSWEGFINGGSAAGLLLLIGGLVGIASTLFKQRGQVKNGGKT